MTTTSSLCAAVLASFLACASRTPSHPLPAIAGTIRYSGGWTHVGARTTTGEWIVYSFEARAGDRVDAYVRSSRGSPAARLVDDGQRPLAESVIDHPDGDTIAAASFGAAKTGTYYLYFRDRADGRATFEVQLGGSFACHRDADCERAGEATGDPSAPSPLDIVPYCMFAEGGPEGSCKGMTRGSVSGQSAPKPGETNVR